MTGCKGLEVPAGPLMIHASCVYVANRARKVQPKLSPCLFEHWERKEESVLVLLLPSQIQAVGEGLQLLLSQPLLLLHVLLPNEQRGLGLDEAPVVLQLLGGQLTWQEGGDQVLSPVQVILQIFGILPLFAQQAVATVQRLLSAETEGKEDKLHLISSTGYISSLSYMILLGKRNTLGLLLQPCPGVKFMACTALDPCW